MVNAINNKSAQTGVRAIDSESDDLGVTLVADDGRNIDLVFSGDLTGASQPGKIGDKLAGVLKERGLEAGRVRVAAICSVCAEPFTKHMTTFSDALRAMGPAKAKATEPQEPQA